MYASWVYYRAQTLIMCVLLKAMWNKFLKQNEQTVKLGFNVLIIVIEYCAEDMNTLHSDCKLKEKIWIQNYESFV